MASLDIPNTLDSVIVEAALKEAGRQSYGVFLWYAGRDSAGQHHAFRFHRGAALANFHAILKERALASIKGPFKTRTLAMASAAWDPVTAPSTTRGGRPRKPEAERTVVATVRLTPDRRDKLQRLGAAWLSKALDAE